MPMILQPTGDTICLWCEGNTAILGHTKTQEARHLDVPPGREADDVWDIALGDTGHAVLVRVDLATTQWAQQSFEYRVYTDGAQEFVVDSNDQSQSLPAFLNRHRLATVGVSLGVTGTKVTMNVAIFDRRPGGAVLWWSLVDFFAVAGLSYKKFTASEWVNKHTQRWVDWLHSVGFPTDHLRRAMPYNRGGVAEVDHTRPLGWPSASTVALVVMCARWVAKPMARGGMTDDNKPKVLEFLRSLLLRLEWSGAEWHFELFLESYRWAPPLPVVGGMPVEVHVRGLAVDLPRLRGDLLGMDREAPVRSALQLLIEPWVGVAGMQPSLLDWVLHCFGHKPIPDVDKFAVQILIQMGMRLDGIVRGEQVVPDASADGGAARAHLAGKEDLAVQCGGDSAEHWRAKLRDCFKYHMAGLRSFGDIKEVSLSIDFARVSRRGCGSVAITNPMGECYLPLPQAIPDYRGELDVARETANTDAKQVEDTAWKRRVRSWLGKRHRRSEDDQADQPVRKKHRKKAREWLLATDNVWKLQTGAKNGWLSFQVLGEAVGGGDHWSWPHCKIPVDQGSDNVSAVLALIYKCKCNVTLVGDASHGAKNDLVLGLRRTGLLPQVSLMSIVWNIAYASWDTGARFHEAQESVQEWLQDPFGDELLQEYMADLFDDLGIADDGAEGDSEQKAVAALRDAACFWKRGTKYSSNRFMSVVFKLREFMPNWTALLLGLLRFALAVGQLHGKSFKELCDKRSSLVLGGGQEGESHPNLGLRAEQRATQQKLRNICNSNLQLAIFMLSDPEVKWRMKVIKEVAGPLADWHTAASTELRSPSGNRDWLVNQCGGGFAQHLASIFGTIVDRRCLENIGLDIAVLPEDLADPQAALNDPALGMQDEMMSTMGSFATALVAMRAKRGLHYMRGWPTLFCLFDTDFSAQPTLDLFRADYSNYEALCEIASRSSAAMVERSLFQHRSVLQMVLMCKDVDWQPDMYLASRVSERSATHANSQINEDIFQRLRHLESSSGNSMTAMVSQWHHMLKRRIASEVHHYREIDTSEVAMSRGLDKLPTRLSRGRISDLAPELRQVCSYDSKPSWFTTNPDGLVGLVADLAVTEEVRASGDWARLDRVWLASLFDDAKLLIRKASASVVDPWFMVLTSVCGRAVLAWEVAEHYETTKDGGFFSVMAPRTDTIGKNPFRILVISDLGEWHGRSYDWECPRRILLNTGESESRRGIGACIVPSPEVRPLLKALAVEGFFEAGLVLLKRLSAHLRIELPRDGDRNCLFDVLRNLVQNILVCDEPACLDNIRRRVATKYVDAEDFLKLSEAMDVLNEDDRREMEDEKKRQTEKVSSLAGFRKKYYEARATIVQQRQAQQVGLAPLHRPNERVAQRRLAARVRAQEVEELSQPEARTLLPEHTSIWRDRGRGRWCVHVAGYRRFSRPFADGGELNSYWKILADAWRLALRDQGLPDEACWVPNLL